MTNGEKIRSMSDEEIADWWCENVRCGSGCPVYDECLGDHRAAKYVDLRCDQVIKMWLKQEAQDE